MEDDYNWGMILKAAIPASALAGTFFYFSFSNFMRWLILVLSVLTCAAIVYSISKKKSNIFTASAIVILAALLVKFLRSNGFI